MVAIYKDQTKLENPSQSLRVGDLSKEYSFKDIARSQPSSFLISDF